MSSTTASPTIPEAEVQGLSVQDAETRTRDCFLPILRAHGIVRVEINYDGEGDEGSVTDVSAFSAAGEADLPEAACAYFSADYLGAVKAHSGTLEDALTDFADHALCARHEYWEVGGGAHGTLSIDVTTGVVTLTHNVRFTDYQTFETEF